MYNIDKFLFFTKNNVNISINDNRTQIISSIYDILNRQIYSNSTLRTDIIVLYHYSR